MTKQTVTITDNATGKQVELDVLCPTSGPKAIDIRKLHKELGYFTYDPGFLATASCSSRITYLTGTRAHCSIVAIRLSNWQSTVRSWKFAICC